MGVTISCVHLFVISVSVSVSVSIQAFVAMSLLIFLEVTYIFVCQRASCVHLFIFKSLCLILRHGLTVSL